MRTISSSTHATAKLHSRWHKNVFLFWTGGVLLGLLALVVSLIVVGASYQAIATAKDQRTYPPPGRLVDVGGYQLHITCLGQGSPAVILEAGNGASSLDWFAVQPEVARTTRVCAYDRAGSGWSERGTGDRSGPTIVRELHTLLTNAGIAPPFVLVGHSYGGLYARLYADQYPDEVIGMVLVDATHPDTWTWGPEAQRLYERQRQQFSLYPVLARLGLLRLQTRSITPPQDHAMTPEQLATWRALASTNRYADAAVAEYNDSLAVMALVRAAGNLGTRPLGVVTAEGDHTYGRAETDELERRHLAMQHELVGLSTNSVQQIVPGASHGSLLYNQEHARITSTMILCVFETARMGEPLEQSNSAP